MTITAVNWARLKVHGPYRLRRGAWYAVRAVANEAVMVHVAGRWVRVPWAAVEVTESLPSRWTVVPRPANAVMIPTSWGAHYAVCPRCRHRAPLQGQPESMQCPRCGKLSPVAWDEAYLGRK
jgi:hypothetical protein